MDITTFLASIWGPIILAVGVGIFTNNSFYQKVYRDIEKDALAGLVFGMLAMAIGIIQIQMHNVWDTFPQIVISLFGWAILLKGTLFILAPRFVDSVSDRWASLKLIPFAGTLALVAGGYLTYFAYLA